MIIITDIKYIETDRDPYKIIVSKDPRDYVAISRCGEPEMLLVEELRELIRGRRFRRPSDNLDIIIGVSQQAQDVIGIQYEAWETTENMIDSLGNTNRRLFNATLWTRIKWLFKGVS